MRTPRTYTLPEVVFWSLIVWCVMTVVSAVVIAVYR